jgi:uncharacterized protein YjbJ (UPF0337 family)
MSEEFDEAKGKAKEAAGDLTGDEDLKRKGKLDQAGASVKKKVGEGVDKVKEEVDDVLDNEDER